jgi:hypothetical protein
MKEKKYFQLMFFLSLGDSNLIHVK